jgi:hypothetical protein
MDCKSKSFSNVIVSEVSVDDFNKVIEKYDSSENKYKKILNNLELILEGQEVTQKDLQLGFIGLAKQNSKLIDLNINSAIRNSDVRIKCNEERTSRESCTKGEMV